MVIVVCGPGGVGKGTVVARLVSDDPSLWLSRSWTTRDRRPGEDDDAYVFVDRSTFEAAIAEGRFLEHAEFLGNLYGTPWPEARDGQDVVLEIEVQGAAQVLERIPDALVILLEPPSPEVQAERMLGRGDRPDRVAERVAVAAAEVAEGRRLGGIRVVNDDLDRAIAEVRAIIAARRA